MVSAFFSKMYLLGVSRKTNDFHVFLQAPFILMLRPGRVAMIC